MFIKSTTLFLMAVLVSGISAQADIVVYTDRAAKVFANAASEFEKQTGESVVFVEKPYKDLLRTLEAEGDQTMADLIITKDLVYLTELVDKKMLKSFVDTPALKRVSPFMRDSQNRWVALTFRVRTAAYDPGRVAVSELTTYEDLASPKWQGRLCLRTSQAAYTEALVAGLIHKHDEVVAREIVKGWVANLAAPTMGSDTEILEAIAMGVCDVGIVNHYYLAGIVAKNPQFPVKIAYLNQDDGGVFTNGVGVGLIAASKKAKLAQTFAETLLQDNIQLELSSSHFDFPAVSGLTPSTLIKDWGPFKMNLTPWDELGEWVPVARQLFKDVGYE